MPALLQRRRVITFLGVLVVLAAAGWTATSKPVPAKSMVSSAITGVAAVESPAPSDRSPRGTPVRAEARPEQATPAEVRASAPAQAAPAAAQPPGMVAYLDPATGLVGGMPPGGPDSRTALQRANVIEPIDAIAADGSPMRIMNGTTEEYAVLRLDTKGNRRMACGPDPKALLTAPLPPPPFEEK
jgi:hypothetical protein